MTLHGLIEILQVYIEKYGDLPIYTTSYADLATYQFPLMQFNIRHFQEGENSEQILPERVVIR